MARRRTKTDSIVVHESASTFGDAELIRRWHIARGWSDIGYHAVILNGHRSAGSAYNKTLDGKIEPGRSEMLVGAHCNAGGMNNRSLGVCLIGYPGRGSYPTDRQISALIHYLVKKCRQYNVQVSNITQHSDHDKGKPLCASLDMDSIRAQVRERMRK